MMASGAPEELGVEPRLAADGTTCRHGGCEHRLDEKYRNWLVSCGGVAPPAESIKDEDMVCRYHSGGPVFHEGLKGWSCCDKRVIDFDSFLKIPGCTTGSHDYSAAAKPIPVSTNSKETTSNAAFHELTDENGVTTYSSHPPASSASVAQLDREKTIQERTTQKTAAPIAQAEVPEDEPGVVVAADRICKRKGCGHRYVSEDVSRGENSEEAVCNFHPGEPGAYL